MTKRFKRIAVIISVITMMISTYVGVLAAHKLDNIPLGNTADLVSLDSPDENVGMVNVLLIGVDEDGYRSDTIMLVSLDDYSDRVSVLSIPRDTMVRINGSVQKINATMGFGLSKPTAAPDSEDAEDADENGDTDENGDAEENSENQNKIPESKYDDIHPSDLALGEGHEDLLINKVKEITGLPVHYYVTVDFDGFVELINAVDGVDFNVPYDMDYDDPVQSLHIHLEAGEQHLDGKHAHDFVRFRHNNDGTAPGEYVMGDEGRVYWQQRFIKEIVKQKLNPYYISKLDRIFEVFRNNVRTNLTMSDVVKNLNALMGISLDDISTYQLPGEAEYINEVWYYIQDVPSTRRLVSEVFLPQTREEWEAYLEENKATSEPSDTESTPEAEDADETE